MFDRVPITAQIYTVTVWVADYFCRFSRKLAELSVLNFPRSISKGIFSRTAPLKTNVTYNGLWERGACLWRIYVSTLP